MEIFLEREGWLLVNKTCSPTFQVYNYVHEIGEIRKEVKLAELYEIGEGGGWQGGVYTL